LNKYTDLLRQGIAQAGYSEILTLSLCSIQENFDLLRRPNDSSAVIIANPKTKEFQAGRTTLLVGLLKTICSNKDHPLPVKLFEISDVMLKDARTEVGARNDRRLCVVIYDKTPGFEGIHGVLDRTMLLLGVTFDHETGYHLQGSDDPAFFPKRAADVMWRGQKVGVLGILHPEVIKNFDLIYPASALELRLEPFLHNKMEARE